MNSKGKAWIILLVLLAAHWAAAAQSTMGRDFWVTQYPDQDHSIAGNTYYTLKLLVSGPRSCTGTAFNPNTGWSVPFQVEPNATTTVSIPYSETSTIGSSRVSNAGIHVVTTDIVTLTAYTLDGCWFETSLVFPTPTLGDEYMIQSAPAVLYDMAGFCIVATEDHTVIDIVTTCNATGGLHANNPFSVVLNAGQCYRLETVTGSTWAFPKDFSGTHIKAREGKRIAVFVGNKTRHIWEQLPPMKCCGKRFVVTGTKQLESDTVRITALQDRCAVRRNGVLVATLDRGETYQYGMSSDSLLDFVETTQPAIVYDYPTCLPSSGQFTNRNRSMSPMAPLEQKANYVVFASLERADLFNYYLNHWSAHHYVNVIAEEEAVPSMRLDGKSISSQFRSVPHGPGYSYATVPVQKGVHTLTCDNGGFVGRVFGDCLNTNSPDSYSPQSSMFYGHSLGGMLHDLSPQIVVNGIYSADSPESLYFCDDTIQFSLFTDFEVSRAVWDFGDGDTVTGCPVSHRYPHVGDFTVSCDLYTPFSPSDSLANSHDSLVTTAKATVHIQQPTERDVWKTQCDSYYWHGTHCTESGVYPVMLQSLGGCDSLVNLHITILRSDTAYYTATACEEYRWRDSLYTESGRYLHLEGANGVGCDSVAVLELTVKRPVAFDIMGYTQVAHASDIWPGVYYYYAVDSTRLEKVPLVWECSNPEWRVVHKGDYSCALFVATTGQATLTATSYGCCASTGSVTLNATAFGLEEAAGSGVAIVPNPATGSVTVTAENLRKVEIHNPLGQPVASSDCDGDSVTIDLQSLPQGIYLVGITLNDGRRCTRQLVVQ